MFASLALNSFTAQSVDALTRAMNDIESILTNNAIQVNGLTFFGNGAPSEITRSDISCGYDAATGTGYGWQLYENTNYYTRVFRAKSSEHADSYIYLRIILNNTSGLGMDINLEIGDLLSTSTNTNRCAPTNGYVTMPDNATVASNSRLFIYATKEFVMFHTRNVEDSRLGSPTDFANATFW